MKESLEQSRKLGAKIRKVLDPLDPVEDKGLKKSDEIEALKIEEAAVDKEPEPINFIEAEIEEFEQKVKYNEEIKAQEKNESDEESAKYKNRKKTRKFFRSHQSNKDGVFED